MTTQRSREAEIEYLDMVKHDSRSKPNRDQASSGLEDDGWLTGFRQLIKEYIMSEPDVARVSNESEAYVLIEEKTEEDMQTEEPAVEEEISVSKVTSEESSISWPAGAESGQVNGQAVEEKRERKRITKNISLTQEEMESDKAQKAISGRLAQFQKACQKENDPTQSPTRSSSKRLDLAKYQPMSTDPENKRATVTKRLDTSRFSKFEGDTTDSATPVKVTRNFTISSTGKKANYEKQTNMVTPNSDKCVVCKKTVYPMEKVQADGITYHKTCFRCKECNRVLALGSFAQSKQFLYCKPHFAQLFKLKGNYDEGFDGSSRATRISAIPDSENGFDQADNQQASEEDALQHFEGTKSLKDQFEKGGVSNVTVKKSFEGETITRTSQSYDETTPEDKQVSENEPVLRPDVVRSSDVVDDRAAIRGMRTLRDQFEKGEATQSSPGKSFDFEEEIRAAKEAEVEMNLGQVSESTPVRDENVVRSDVKAEEVKTFSGGIRSLKDRFEKGGVSNIETTPAKPTVEVHSLEDFNPDVTERGVSENTPVVRDDVVRSSQKVEDSFFKAGGARSLKARFEQGNVSNLEEKPKEKIEVTPRSLEDYGQEQDAVDQGGVSENTPVQRDDVVKEGKGEEDPGIKRGAARSLRSLFEKGEVHNIEEKPRAPLERSPKSLDQLAPSTEGVVENEPEVRSDLVRETSARDEPMNIQSGASRSLKDRWEKGEVETAPEKPKEVIDIRGEGQVAESNPEVREDLVRESLEAPEEISVGAGSLRAQWEAGDVTHAESHVEKEELSPKRLSSYYEGEQDETGQEETGQDETGQEEIGQDETGQVEMGQDEMGQVEPRQEEQGEMEEPQEEEVKMEQPQEVEDEMEQPQEVEDEIQPPEEEVETEAVNRYSEEDGNEEPVNGHAQENGFEIEVASPENEEAEPAEDSSTPVETAPGQDIASWEIKAARAAAIQSQDADEDANEYANEDANEEPSKEGGEGLLIEF